MKPKPLVTSLFLLPVVLISSCKKNDVIINDPCTGLNYTIVTTKTESIGLSNNGTLTILEPRGDTVSYKLNNGSYQASWYFTGLAPGNYIITIKNQKNCTDTAQVTILNYGPKYALVKEIIIGYCGPCHRNGGIDGGKNFDTDENIINNWDRIKARAADNIPSQMPPALDNAPLTNVDKQKIINWVNAGHRQSD